MSTPRPTTLSITSLEALERLLGGDSELEVELRNHVVQDFAKRHLKSLANSETIKNAVDVINEEIKKTFREEAQKTLGTFTYANYKNSFQLLPSIKQAIQEEARSYCASLFASYLQGVKDELKSKYTPEYFKAAVEDYAKNLSNVLIKSEVEKRLQAIKNNL